MKAIEKRLTALEQRVHPEYSTSRPYWLNPNETDEERMARYRAYFEAL